jgi:hypothetical protein
MGPLQPSRWQSGRANPPQALHPGISPSISNQAKLRPLLIGAWWLHSAPWQSAWVLPAGTLTIATPSPEMSMQVPAVVNRTGPAAAPCEP